MSSFLKHLVRNCETLRSDDAEALFNGFPRFRAHLFRVESGERLDHFRRQSSSHSSHSSRVARYDSTSSSIAGHSRLHYLRSRLHHHSFTRLSSDARFLFFHHSAVGRDGGGCGGSGGDDDAFGFRDPGGFF